MVEIMLIEINLRKERVLSVLIARKQYYDFCIAGDSFSSVKATIQSQSNKRNNSVCFKNYTTRTTRVIIISCSILFTTKYLLDYIQSHLKFDQ